MHSNESDNDESEEIDDESDEEACTTVRNTWKSLSPKVTTEKDLIGKFYAIIYETKKKQQLYVGRVVLETQRRKWNHIGKYSTESTRCAGTVFFHENKLWRQKLHQKKRVFVTQKWLPLRHNTQK